MLRTKKEFSLILLLPNMVTIAAICAGMTAIRFGIQGDFHMAVKLILAACVLDGIDGRLARILGSNSRMGAELDSLADFLNFGVAPPLVIYLWALQDWARAGWIFVLIFAICCVIRLARFNVSSKSEITEDKAFFTGVPAPAGAMLAMLPIYISFALPEMSELPAILICGYLGFIGFLLISRIPTWSFKTVKIAQERVKFVLVAFVGLGAALLTYEWTTLIVICMLYFVIILWSIKKKAATQKKNVNT